MYFCSVVALIHIQYCDQSCTDICGDCILFAHGSKIITEILISESLKNEKLFLKHGLY